VFEDHRYIIFSDLDGTFLDHDTYGYTDALGALQLIKDQKIPLIFCSSKTRLEIEWYRQRLGLEDPFISENGAAIFIGKEMVAVHDVPFVEYGGYKVIELGIPYHSIRKFFAEIKRETGLNLFGFSEMSVAQVAEFTGLNPDMAALAHVRDYSEPFLFMEEECRVEVLEKAAHKRGLKMTRGGRFYHLIGDSDKGKAVSILKRLYNKAGRATMSIGLGDSLNDFPMLENVDVPVLVKKKNGRYESCPRLKKMVFAPGIGPKGWNRAVLDILTA
jgi:mannosyl-3-phosphoglycerate phosphatase